MKYYLVRKKIKNMYLKIKNQAIYVHAPLNMPQATIEEFIKHKQAWIQTTLQKEANFLKKYTIDNKVYIFSKMYVIHTDSKFTIKDDQITTPNTQTLEKNLRIMLEQYVKPVFQHYVALLSEYFETPKLKFAYLKGKWGVCYTRKKEIVLSYKLIHTNHQFIDYVVLHELAHLVHPNHSKQFYYFIEKYMPNYKEIIKLEHSMLDEID